MTKLLITIATVLIIGCATPQPVVEPQPPTQEAKVEQPDFVPTSENYWDITVNCSGIFSSAYLKAPDMMTRQMYAAYSTYIKYMYDEFASRKYKNDTQKLDAEMDRWHKEAFDKGEYYMSDAGKNELPAQMAKCVELTDYIVQLAHTLSRKRAHEEWLDTQGPGI